MKQLIKVIAAQIYCRIPTCQIWSETQPKTTMSKMGRKVTRFDKLDMTINLCKEHSYYTVTYKHRNTGVVYNHARMVDPYKSVTRSALVPVPVRL